MPRFFPSFGRSREHARTEYPVYDDYEPYEQPQRSHTPAWRKVIPNLKGGDHRAPRVRLQNKYKYISLLMLTTDSDLGGRIRRISRVLRGQRISPRLPFPSVPRIRLRRPIRVYHQPPRRSLPRSLRQQHPHRSEREFSEPPGGSIHESRSVTTSRHRGVPSPGHP